MAVYRLNGHAKSGGDLFISPARQQVVKYLALPQAEPALASDGVLLVSSPIGGAGPPV